MAHKEAVDRLERRLKRFITFLNQNNVNANLNITDTRSLRTFRRATDIIPNRVLQAYLKKEGEAGYSSNVKDELIARIYWFLVECRFTRRTLKLFDRVLVTKVDIGTFLKKTTDMYTGHSVATKDDLRSLAVTAARMNFPNVLDYFSREQLQVFVDDYDLQQDYPSVAPREAVESFLNEAEFKPAVVDLPETRLASRLQTMELRDITPTEDTVLLAIETRAAQRKKTGLHGIYYQHEYSSDDSLVKHLSESERNKFRQDIKDIVQQLLDKGKIVEKPSSSGYYTQYQVVKDAAPFTVSGSSGSAMEAANAEFASAEDSSKKKGNDAEALQAQQPRDSAQQPPQQPRDSAQQPSVPAPFEGKSDKTYFEDVQKNIKKIRAKAKERIRKLQENDTSASTKDAIELEPVWLGFIEEYANMRRLISSGEMHKRIVQDARSWSEHDYEFHVLRDFFEPVFVNGKAVGYKVKSGYEFDVDHALPKAWGGWDHPRNYLVMARSLNKSLQDNIDEKFALVGPQITRQIQYFAQKMRQFTEAHAEAALRLLPDLHYRY